MNLSINQAIFMTNTFAEANKEVHVNLWNDFERDVPVAQRSGYFGADNVAYIMYLRKRKEPLFFDFFSESLEGRGQ